MKTLGSLCKMTALDEMLPWDIIILQGICDFQKPKYKHHLTKNRVFWCKWWLHRDSQPGLSSLLSVRSSKTEFHLSRAQTFRNTTPFSCMQKTDWTLPQTGLRTTSCYLQVCQQQHKPHSVCMQGDVFSFWNVLFCIVWWCCCYLSHHSGVKGLNTSVRVMESGMYGSWYQGPSNGVSPGVDRWR